MNRYTNVILIYYFMFFLFIFRRSTELGLLHFSPPSPQEPKNVLIDWPRAGSQSFSTAEDESV